AHALAKHGAGRELRQILTSYAGILLDQHLATWRNTLRTELRTNSSGFLDRRYPKLADNIPDTFPDLHVVRLYTNPWTSWLPQFHGKTPDVALWVPRESAVHEISAFCREHLHWDAAQMKKCFVNLLWPGVAFRMISSRYVMYNPENKTFATPSTNGRLVKISKRPFADQGTPAMDIMRIRISISNF
ncbi:hypothetical protein FB451DRAFT_1008950, partial [Mycena latifolia]